MAEGKKSFIAYCDWMETFEELSDEEAGKLVKHLFKYVNDESPETSDKLTKMCFIPIQQSLKRDLQKYDKYIGKQKVNGSKGGRPKKNPTEPNKPTALLINPTEPKKADSVSVSVSVSVNDSVINKDKEIVFSDWLEYRKEIKKPIKANKTLTGLIDQFNKASLKECEYVVNNSITNQWTGLFWDKYIEPKAKQPLKIKIPI